MGQGKYYHYFVEGENEEKLIKVLKTDLQMIIPGKVQTFNIVEKKLTRTRIMSLKKGTTVVLVFDTDTGNAAILQDNIAFLKKEGTVKEVLCVAQVRNLEDELVRSCNIKQIRELTGSRSNRDFKRDMIKDNNFDQKLLQHGFDLGKFWNEMPGDEYRGIKNDGYRIKAG